LKRPIVLTIAGLDPSGCAGLLADVKTMQAQGVYGMAVCTANTVQNVNEFENPNWIRPEEIVEQIRCLQREFKFEYIKIGLVESVSVLNSILDELIAFNPEVKIIWDPICKASASFEFHKEINSESLERICSRLYLLTPNLDELAVLGGSGKFLARFCNTLVKGGHGLGDTSVDTLFTGDEICAFEGKRLMGFSKRGTGCVLSSAILSNLANGMDLIRACREAKEYVFNFLMSNPSKIGVHEKKLC
jgi:hydroxymethylpyrimidine/phosphomethylpyrimidine kinase